MSKLTVVDKLMEFASKNEDALDRALSSMAEDIERLSKRQVPHRHGQLAGSGRHVRKGKLRYEVQYNIEYALYQHEGQRQDGTHIVRRYSKPGKKKHYLKDPGALIAKSAVTYFKREADRVGVRV